MKLLNAIYEWMISKFEPKYCPNCEYFKLELSKQQAETKWAVSTLFEVLHPTLKDEDSNKLEERKPLQSYVPWSMRKQQLEFADRMKARELNINKQMKIDSNKSTEELEEELLGKDNG